MRILSFSTVFPNPVEPAYGVFVRNRLVHLNELAAVEVLAPVPVLDWSRRQDLRWARAVPASRDERGVPVQHPRWVYPPLGTPLNCAALFTQVLPDVLERCGRADLIDSHFAYPEGVVAAMLSARTGLPFSVTLRGNEPKHAEQPERRRLIRWALRRAGRVIAVSENLRQFALEMGVAPERVRTIPNGIEAGKFAPQDRAASRRQFGFGPDERVIVSVGTLIERKGHHRTITAAHQLRQEGIACTVVIAGGPGREGDYRTEIKETIERLGMAPHVRMLGEIAQVELPALLSASDVMSLATRREGWPNVVHEALACGTPVVATRVGGIPEMIDDGQQGFVVPFDDAPALAQGLRQALTGDWDRDAISHAARSRTWSKVAEEVHEELTVMLAERRCGQESMGRL